jgi:hypothetical protein
MKIRNVSSGRVRVDQRTPSKQEKVKRSESISTEETQQKKVSFVEELRKTGDLRTKEVLDEVLSEIDEAAKDFLERPIYGNLLRYKELVKRFMKVVVSKLYRTRETISSRRVDPQKIYTLIEEVDKNLGLLTEEVLSGQADSLSLMAKIDEIRGLLVDLYT